ncbi:MAG: SEC-C domain-containing protein [Ottowia sp.]|nr:SEC-C domain-containing protein [Ottowia sp.]
MPKIGRNDPCPCESGKKYKKCHGGIAHLERIAQVMAAVPGMRARHEAKEHQRTEQQGLGKPIIAVKMDNGHLVAVKNRLHYSKKWQTFHSFLIDYLTGAIGSEWCNAELKKPFDQRHPVLVWHHKLREQQRLFIKESGKVASFPMTGAVAAYMHLAYDLYALDHNAELQAKLVERLRNHEQFHGAHYEIQVAAILVRAGFTLAFENEDDRSTSHCEFTATNTRTGKPFSVEAKRSRSERCRVNRLLSQALKKAANHTRIVFIDLNAPDSSIDKEMPAYVKRAFNLVRRFETDPQTKQLPPAYVFLTNSPWEHHLDDIAGRQVALGDSFRIDDFKFNYLYSSLRAAINSRQAHIEMHELLKSMRTHAEIPATFDGDNPELAFVNGEDRLIIGNRYMVPGADGTEIEGVLTSAVVMEDEKVAMGTFNTNDARKILVRIPLADAEIAAWKRHPHTFFGEISGGRKSVTALDLYDFFLETYSKTSKNKLLEFLASSKDIKQLATLSQSELASVYCERLAESAFVEVGPGPKPLLESK